MATPTTPAARKRVLEITKSQNALLTKEELDRYRSLKSHNFVEICGTNVFNYFLDIVKEYPNFYNLSVSEIVLPNLIRNLLAKSAWCLIVWRILDRFPGENEKMIFAAWRNVRKCYFGRELSAQAMARLSFLGTDFEVTSDEEESYDDTKKFDLATRKCKHHSNKSSGSQRRAVMQKPQSPAVYKSTSSEQFLMHTVNTAQGTGSSMPISILHCQVPDYRVQLWGANQFQPPPLVHPYPGQFSTPPPPINQGFAPPPANIPTYPYSNVEQYQASSAFCINSILHDDGSDGVCQASANHGPVHPPPPANIVPTFQHQPVAPHPFLYMNPITTLSSAAFSSMWPVISSGAFTGTFNSTSRFFNSTVTFPPNRGHKTGQDHKSTLKNPKKERQTEFVLPPHPNYSNMKNHPPGGAGKQEMRHRRIAPNPVNRARPDQKPVVTGFQPYGAIFLPPIPEVKEGTQKRAIKSEPVDFEEKAIKKEDQ